MMDVSWDVLSVGQKNKKNIWIFCGFIWANHKKRARLDKDLEKQILYNFYESNHLKFVCKGDGANDGQ